MSFKRPFAVLGRAVAVATLLATAGCGFKPIASTLNDDQTLRVRSLKIDAESRRFEYDLDQALNRVLITDAAAPNRLAVKVSIEDQGLAIEQDDAVTRYNLTATAVYELTGTDGAEVTQGRVISVTALNATSSLYATEVNRRDALERLASDISSRIIAALRVRGLSAQAQ